MSTFQCLRDSRLEKEASIKKGNGTGERDYCSVKCITHANTENENNAEQNQFRVAVTDLSWNSSP
jgi:hypothetical protein